jgi:hypothetical protein
VDSSARRRYLIHVDLHFLQRVFEENSNSTLKSVSAVELALKRVQPGRYALQMDLRDPSAFGMGNAASVDAAKMYVQRRQYV